MSAALPTDQIASASVGLFASRGSPEGSKRAGCLLQSSYLNTSSTFSVVQCAAVRKHCKSSCRSTWMHSPSTFAHDLLSIVTTMSFFLKLCSWTLFRCIDPIILHLASFAFSAFTVLSAQFTGLSALVAMFCSEESRSKGVCFEDMPGYFSYPCHLLPV